MTWETTILPHTRQKTEKDLLRALLRGKDKGRMAWINQPKQCLQNGTQKTQSTSILQSSHHRYTMDQGSNDAYSKPSLGPHLWLATRSHNHSEPYFFIKNKIITLTALCLTQNCPEEHIRKWHNDNDKMLWKIMMYYWNLRCCYHWLH